MTDAVPLVACAIWRCSPALLAALDDNLGDPVDSYVNGSQVWIDDDTADVALEWRLHPVASFAKPKGIATSELFRHTVDRGEPDPTTLWDGLEVFAAYDDEIAPDVLVAASAARLGIGPDASGLVDHESVADAWERSERTISIVAALRAQLP